MVTEVVVWESQVWKEDEVEYILKMKTVNDTERRTKLKQSIKHGVWIII